MGHKAVKATAKTVRQTIVSNLEAPRLKGVTVRHFANFQKRRELYEKEVEEKNRKLGFDIAPTSYKASIDNSLLRTFLTAGWIKAKDIVGITDEQLKECVKTKASFTPDGNDLTRIAYTVRKVKMDTSLKDAEDRVWHLYHRYITVLESAGMQDLPNIKPHIAIEHIFKRIKPALLRQRMKNIVRWRKDEGFEKNDFGVFLRELATQAKKLELEQEALCMSDNEDNSSSSSVSSIVNTRQGRNTKNHKKANKQNSRKRNRDRENADADAERKSSSKKQKRSLPPCLNPDCDENHYIAYCQNSTEEEKEKLRREYRAQKKKRANRKEAPKDESKKRPGMSFNSFQRLAKRSLPRNRVVKLE